TFPLAELKFSRQSGSVRTAVLGRVGLINRELPPASNAYTLLCVVHTNTALYTPFWLLFRRSGTLGNCTLGTNSGSVKIVPSTGRDQSLPKLAVLGLDGT